MEKKKNTTGKTLHESEAAALKTLSLAGLNDVLRKTMIPPVFTVLTLNQRGNAKKKKKGKEIA